MKVYRYSLLEIGKNIVFFALSSVIIGIILNVFWLNIYMALAIPVIVFIVSACGMLVTYNVRAVLEGDVLRFYTRNKTTHTFRLKHCEIRCETDSTVFWRPNDISLYVTDHSRGEGEVYINCNPFGMKGFGILYSDMLHAITEIKPVE